VYYKNNGDQMRKFYIALCGGIVLSGCSSFSERHQASGNFGYLEQESSQEYVLPEGLTPIASNNSYDIPAIGKGVNKALVGAKLDMRAPALVMPVAPNSLSSNEVNATQVVFESFLAEQAFRDDLWQKLSLFIEEHNYGVGLSREGQELTTRSIESDPYFQVIFGLDEEFKLSQQYQFKLAVDGQGHRATVDVELTKHLEQDAEVELNKFAKRRYETRMLNKFLSHVYMQHNKSILADRLKARAGLVTEMAFDQDNNSVYKVASSFNLVWEKLAIVLPKLGFVIDDRDKTVNTYYTHFEAVDSGFWSGLFSEDSDVPPLTLTKDAKYQITLKEDGKSSQLSILDAHGDKLSAEKIAEMYPTISRILAQKIL